MDLNLAELGPDPDPKNLAGAVMSVLEQIVAENAGPYVVVFWTEVTGKVPEVRDIILDRMKNRPPPLDVLELPKAQFLPAAKVKGESLEHDLQALFSGLARSLPSLAKEVARLAAAKPELSVVAGWEARAFEAAARTVNEVTNHARDDADHDPRRVATSLITLLAAIARVAAGQTHAEEEPARTLDYGMAEILYDQFSASVDDNEYSGAVRNCLGPVIQARTKFSKPDKVVPGLNTFFHVDDQTDGVKTTARGAVIPGAKLLTASLLGRTHIDLLRTEFMLNPDGDQELEAVAKLMLVEAGADCDHAQGKPRTLRYLAAFEIPVGHLNLVWTKKRGLAHAALQLLGPWSINGGIFLLVSCRRFYTWQAEKPPKGKLQYRVRSGVVNKLLHHYANTHTRPGIVEFFM